MSTLVFASIQTYGEIFTLSNPGTAASVHARQAIPLVYTRIGGVAPPAGETIDALTYATTLTSGATFDQTLGDWAIVTHVGTGTLTVVPLQAVIALPALIASGTYAILAWVTRDRIYPWPQIAIPSMHTEGGMWKNHSTGDPTDPLTPPVPTEMPVGGVGQILQVVPDTLAFEGADHDPHQATNHTADPAWTTFTQANGSMVAYRYDSEGNPLLSEVPVGTDGQVLAARLDSSSYTSGGVPTTADQPSYQNVAWVLKHLLNTRGSLVVGAPGTPLPSDPSGDSLKLPLGADHTVLTSDGTDAVWKSIAYALAAYLTAEGSMLYAHSPTPTGDPTVTPPVLKELLIQKVGATTPKVGQLLETARDTDDPAQSTNDSADPSWTQLALAEALLPLWQTKRSGALKLAGLPIGTLNQILSVARQSGGSGHGPYDPTSTDATPVYATNVDELAYQDIKTILGAFLAAAGNLPMGTASGADATLLTPGADKTILRSHGAGAALTWETVSDALKAVIPDSGDMIINSGGTPVALAAPTSGFDRGFLAIDNNLAGTPFWVTQGTTNVPAFPVLTSSGFIWLPRPTNTSVLVFDTAGHFNWVDMSTPGDLLVNIGGSIQVLGAPSGPSVLTFSSGVVTWLTNTGGGDKFVKIDSTSGPHLT